MKARLSLWRSGILVLLLTSFAASVQGQTLDAIKAERVLRVCIWPDYFGISYRNPHTGALQGIDITLSGEFAKDLEVPLQYVETDFSRVIADIENNKCHIAMMGVGVIPARSERVAFSDPYLRSDVYAITTRANKGIQSWEDIDQPGRVVAVLKGTLMEPLMRRTLKHAELRITTQPGERERDVESGRADVFITDFPYSKRMLLNTDWARLISPSAPVELTDYAYAVPQGDPGWLERVNQFVRAIKMDGRLARAAEPYGLLPILVRD